VLVVDDDEAVLELAREVLASAGFAVVAVASGAAAIEELRAAPAVQAVVLDLAMPDMDGPALAGHLRALRPDLALVLVTGFDAAHAVERFAAHPVDAFVRKPWEPEELIGAVQRALSERAAAAAPGA
jgi:CheY-like chemotaxis protein